MSQIHKLLKAAAIVLGHVRFTVSEDGNIRSFADNQGEGELVEGTQREEIESLATSFPDPAPERVSSRQFKLQMLEPILPNFPNGIYEQVGTWIHSQEKAIQIAYENSSTFVRTDEMMQVGFTALGFTEEQIDKFFLDASKL